MPATRQLAAIMFTDMVGYTALMQADEALARANQLKHKHAFEKYVEQFHGRILQYYGDGTLSIFNSALDSVNCAISIQQELMQSPKVDLRIGIHTGDVVYDETGIYGDCVNVASRIESLAKPGAEILNTWSEAIPDLPLLSSLAGYAFAKTGRHDKAKAALAKLTELDKQENGSPMSPLIALLYMALGDKENFYTHFEQGMKSKMLFCLYFYSSFLLAEVNGEERIRKLRRERQLPE